MTLKFLADLINKITGIFSSKCFFSTSSNRLGDLRHVPRLLRGRWRWRRRRRSPSEPRDPAEADWKGQDCRWRRAVQKVPRIHFLFSLTVNYEKVPMIIFLLQKMQKTLIWKCVKSFLLVTFFIGIINNLVKFDEKNRQ